MTNVRIHNFAELPRAPAHSDTAFSRIASFILRS